MKKNFTPPDPEILRLRAALDSLYLKPSRYKATKKYKAELRRVQFELNSRVNEARANRWRELGPASGLTKEQSPTKEPAKATYQNGLPNTPTEPALHNGCSVARPETTEEKK